MAKMYKLYLTEEELEALRNVIDFPDTQLEDGLAVFVPVEMAPYNALTKEDEEALHKYQMRLYHTLHNKVNYDMIEINGKSVRAQVIEVISDQSIFEENVHRIKRENNQEFLKLVELHELLVSDETMETICEGKDQFILGYGDKIIRFFDHAAMYNAMIEALESVICEY